MEGEGWLNAENLEAGDRLRLADGGMAKVLAIEHQQLSTPAVVYNFTVATFHTYFVLDFQVLVHNVSDEYCGKDARAWRDYYEQEYGKENVTSTTIPARNEKNVKLAGQTHPVTGVEYDERGYPIFNAVYDTGAKVVDPDASSETQMRQATRDLRKAIYNGQVDANIFTREQLEDIIDGEAKVKGYTWHHHQDSGRMQLVDEKIHAKTGHIGGDAMWEGK